MSKYVVEFVESTDGDPSEKKILLPEYEISSVHNSYDEAQCAAAKIRSGLFSDKNPFRYCGGFDGPAGLKFLSDMPFLIYCDWLEDAGIDRPDEKVNWQLWYDNRVEEWTSDQIERVWEPLNLYPFVRVREVEGVIYAVVDKEWVYNDNAYEPTNDGFNINNLYYKYEDALTMTELLNERHFGSPERKQIKDEYVYNFPHYFVRAIPLEKVDE